VGSSFDTLLGVYTGSSVGTLALVASNDDIIPGVNQWSRLSISAVAGTVYRIAVDGFDGSSGNVVLSWSAVPGNDNFANGQVVSGGAGSVNGNNLGATKEANEPDHAANAGGGSIWYYWTAPASGPVTIDTQGSSFDTVLAVYTGTSVGTLTLIASNDDTATNVQSRIDFTAASGTTYRIAVDGYDGDSGMLVLNWNGPSPGTLPLLEIHPNGSQLVLAWPTNHAGYKLESATNLAAGVVWSTNLPSPIIVNGKNTVTDTVSGARKFYRLRQP
jgi:hypothetical protein